MNKKEWAICTDPEAMLRWLQILGNVAKTQGGKRRLRLFFCACCRRLAPLIGDDNAGQVIDLAECFADGLVSKADLMAGKSILDSLRAAAKGGQPHARHAVAALAPLLRPSSSIGDVVEAVTRAARVVGQAAIDRLQPGSASPEDALAEGNWVREEELSAQCGLIREVFGDGYRRSNESLPAHVVGLAEACYAALPAVTDQFRILADALDEAGEPEAAAHCREPFHVKGCHVLDLCLGNQ
jgi:hypothetical protein